MGTTKKRAVIACKESFFIILWITVGALTLWGADAAGLLSSRSLRSSATALQIDFPEVYQLWKKGGAIFVDARSAVDFKRGHIPGAVNVPVNRVKQLLTVLPSSREKRLITYCGSVECPNAYQLMEILLGLRYRNVQFFSRGLCG